MAQSTAYRINTPQGKRIPQLAKPNTEKSLVMNELALKYLRQPVDELMKDMRLGASPKSPNPEPLVAGLRDTSIFFPPSMYRVYLTLLVSEAWFQKKRKIYEK